MANNSVTYFSTASTFLAKRGPGTVYGYQIGAPAAGGTVVIADLVDAGAAPNLGVPSTYGPNVISATTLPASPQPLDVFLHGRRFNSGLTVSITSTQTVTVHFD